MVSLGVSVATIGILESGAGSNGAISSLMQVIGGRYSDRWGRRRLILAGSAFLIICWLTAAAAFFFASTALVYLAYLFWGLSLLSLPVIDAMVADHIETPDRSRVFSTMLVANFIPGAITGFLAGQYGASLSPQLLLLLAAGLETAGFALILAKVRDRGVASMMHKTRVSYRATFRDISRFRGFFSIFMMDALAWSLGTGILYALLSTRGFRQSEFGLVALTQPIGVVLGTVPGGWLTHRIGARRLLMAPEILGAVMVLGWAFYPVEPLVPLYGIVWGFAISCWLPVQFHLSAAMFPERRRGEMLGALATSVVLVRIAGPILAAGLFLFFGYPAPMVAGSLAMFTTIVLIRRFLPQDSRSRL